MSFIKKMYTALIAALFFFLLLPFLYLVSPAKIKDYVYRELCYHTVIDNIKKESDGINDLLEKTAEYVYVNMDAHGHKMPIIDDNSWNCFVRGFGYCDQQAWALATLLAKKNIPARLVMVRSSLSSGHSVSEVLIDGRWVVVDPGSNTVHYNKFNKLATAEDIKNGLVTISGYPREQLSVELYTSYFSGEHPLERWGALTTKQGAMRKGVFSPVYLYYKVFGSRFSRFYQNLYLIGEEDEVAQRNRYLIS